MDNITVVSSAPALCKGATGPGAQVPMETDAASFADTLQSQQTSQQPKIVGQPAADIAAADVTAPEAPAVAIDQNSDLSGQMLAAVMAAPTQQVQQTPLPVEQTQTAINTKTEQNPAAPVPIISETGLPEAPSLQTTTNQKQIQPEVLDMQQSSKLAELEDAKPVGLKQDMVNADSEKQITQKQVLNPQHPSADQPIAAVQSEIPENKLQQSAKVGPRENQVAAGTQQPAPDTGQATAVLADSSRNKSENNDQNSGENKQQLKASLRANVSIEEDMLTLSELSANALKVRKLVQGTSPESSPVLKDSLKTQESGKQPGQKVDIHAVSIPVDTTSTGALKFDLAGKVSTVQSTSVTEMPQKIIDQVVKEVSLIKSAEKSEVVIKLTPPALGTLRLQVTQDAVGMSTQIVASSSRVKEILDNHMPTLVAAMNEAGIKMDSLSVTTDNKFQSGSFDQHRSFNQPQDNPASSRKQSRSSQRFFSAASVVAPAGSAQQSAGTAFAWLA